MDLRYTLIFVTDGDSSVLMLHRRYPPNQGLWNGVGGKIKSGETPLACALREVREETGLELDSIRFAGIVSWTDAEGERGGMYVYIANLPPGEDWEQLEGVQTDEGRLGWWSKDAILSRCLPVVDNIPDFLPSMLAGEPPAQHHCIYDAWGLLSRVNRLPLLFVDLEGVAT